MIGTSATLAATLELAGEENNPFVAWNNLASAGTAATSIGTTQTDGEAANAVTGTTYDRWMALADGSGQAALSVDLGSAQAVGFVAIGAHNLGTLGATVTAQYSSDNVAWTAVDASAHAMTDDVAAGWRVMPASARYWRVLITGLSPSADIARIGVLFVGDVVILPRRFYQGYRPPITQTEVQISSNIAEGGNLVGSAYYERGSTVSASVNNVSPDFLRGAGWKAFQRHFNRGGGFFWAWRPTKYDDMHYAWRAGAAIAPQNSGPLDLMSFSMEMRLHDDA